MDIVYVASLRRSGSTFLQMLLATHPRIVGLGEILQHIENQHLIGPCSCGADGIHCPFWGPILPQIKHRHPSEAFPVIFQHVRKMFPGRTVVDSSKSFVGLRNYALAKDKLGPVSVKVLFLVRDFRGWVRSVGKWAKVLGTSDFRDWYLVSCYRWMYANWRLLRYLRRSGLSYLCISYEELVFNIEKEVSRIGEFLGVPILAPDETSLNKAVAHELFGSPTTKHNLRASSGVIYDHKWLTDLRPVFAAPLLLPVYQFNRFVHLKLAITDPSEGL